MCALGGSFGTVGPAARLPPTARREAASPGDGSLGGDNPGRARQIDDGAREAATQRLADLRVVVMAAAAREVMAGQGRKPRKWQPIVR